MDKPQDYDLIISDSIDVRPARVLFNGDTITVGYGGVTIGFDTALHDTLDAAIADFQAEHQLAERAMYAALRRAKFVGGLRLARAVFYAQSAKLAISEADAALHDDRCSAAVLDERKRMPQQLVETILIGAGWERWTDDSGRPEQASADSVLVDLRTGEHLLGGYYGNSPLKWVDSVTHKRVSTVGEWWRVALTPKERDRHYEWELTLPFDPWKMRIAHNRAVLNDA